jgi:FKBP-type peptidyl-prolyl cis-trans isomerase FklB
MKKLILASAITLACSYANATELKTFEQKLGYALGLDMARGLQEQGLKVDPKALMAGFEDQLKGHKPQLSEQEMAELAKETQQRVIAHQQELHKQQAEKNQKKEAEFFANNAQKPDVISLPEGIQYKVLTEGKGPSPKADDTVVVHYKGSLLSGKIFDSSYNRGNPVRFQLNQVIKGWQIVLPKMKVGDKWKVWIPAKLAYGDRGAGNIIGPNEPLVFEIELLNIEPKKTENNQ